MSLEDVPRCQHVKVNGTQCGSPALHRRRHCYFHDHMLDGKNRFANRQEAKPRAIYSMCLLEDANAVQLAVMQVLQLLGSGQMDTKTAGLMLYGLQIASANLRHTTFEAEKPTDVVIDRNTLDQTCLNGPQWFAQDFTENKKEKKEENKEEKKEEPGQNDTIAASAENATSEADQEAVPAKADQSSCQTNAASVKPHTNQRKRPDRVAIERPPDIVQDLYFKLNPDKAAEYDARLAAGEAMD